jgi:hypothetical protein
MANAVIGLKSMYQPRGWQATTPVHVDDTVFLSPIDGAVGRFGGQMRFSLPKSSTLIGKCYLQLTVQKGITTNPWTDQPAQVQARAAYHKNVGDLFLGNVTVRYGSNVLQNYDGTFQALWRRMTRHDINIEGTNANVLGALPPSSPTEDVLEDALTLRVASGGGAGPHVVPAPGSTQLYIPLEELFFVHHKDEHWMPESLALEGELIVDVPTLPRLIYTNTGLDVFSGAVVLGAGGAVAAEPLITASILRYQEITLTAAEKEKRMVVFKQPEGHVIKFLDLERQPPVTIAGTGGGATLSMTATLDSFRMDGSEIMFCVRRDTNTATATAPAVSKDYAGSDLESSTRTSIITGADVNCVVPIVSFNLTAAGKQIFVSQPEEFNRTVIRKEYHPESQIADYFYTIPWCAFPEDRKNATGHQSYSVLGTLRLNIQFVDSPGASGMAGNYRLDVWSHSHNLMQSRGGGISKAFN